MVTSDTRPNQVAEEAVTVLLDHIARYRLTTFAALERLKPLSVRGPQPIRRLLSACERQSLIGSAWLHAGRKYWYLTAEGAAQLELPESAAGPLSEPAKIRAYALLCFCRLSPQVRHRLTTDELVAHVSDLNRSGLPQGYYFEPAGAGRIGFARIDAGHYGRWDRVVQTVRQDISAHWLQASFRPLIRADRFEITVLTVLPQKARRLSAALGECPDAQRVPVRAVALPELLPLLTPCR